MTVHDLQRQAHRLHAHRFGQGQHDGNKQGQLDHANQFIFEPSPAAVLEQLLPRYVATRLYQAVLETKASEESSRMVAMKNATENADDLIDDLTLSYNKVRQANITREMIEISSGAQAR